MPVDRDVHVHLLPELAPPGRLAGGLALVIDVLRATTTIVHALAAGCTAVRPCVHVEEARQLAGEMRAGRVLLAGERGGVPVPGFDLGNSPHEYTAKLCQGKTVVLTTSNGTRALARAAEAQAARVAEEPAAEARAGHDVKARPAVAARAVEPAAALAAEGPAAPAARVVRPGVERSALTEAATDARAPQDAGSPEPARPGVCPRARRHRVRSLVA